jgi:acetylornithine aminotransferase
MELKNLEEKYFFHTYKRLPLEIEKGEGMYLVSKGGERYLDMFGGLAVNALGYGNKRVTDAIKKQTDKYIHLSNYFLQKPQIELGEMLVQDTGYKRIFFTNSGTESVEGAIKIARKWGEENNKNKIISFTNSFHGRTFGALSLMDKASYKVGFGPFLDNFEIVEYNNIDAIRKTAGTNTAAVILEFIQGEGGIQEASADFAYEIQTLQKKYGFLLIADEIQSGVGRTGRFFGFQHFSLTPDIVVIAKPLGGGLPLGAILGGEKVENVLQPGMHGTTFGGNPVACAAGIAVLQEIKDKNLIENSETVGKFFKTGLTELQNKYPDKIKDVRGKGMMLGMELTKSGDPAVASMRERGILINCTNQNVLRFLPPLIAGKEDIDKCLSELDSVIDAI